MYAFLAESSYNFEARIIEPDPDNQRRLVLAEHTLVTVDPEKAPQELIESIYGSENSERADHIRCRSQKMAFPQEVVSKEITERTFGIIGDGSQSMQTPLPASVTTQEADLDSLLYSELDVAGEEVDS